MSHFKAKMHQKSKIDFDWGSAPDPAGGAYSALADPLAVFKGPTSKRKEGKGEKKRKGEGREEMGGENDLIHPLSQIHAYTPLSPTFVHLFHFAFFNTTKLASPELNN